MKNQIVSAAKQLFAEKGYKQMHVSDLAEKLNISRGNLTYYFPTKDSIVECLFKDYNDRISDWIDYSEIPITGVFARRFYHMVIHDINLLQHDISTRFYFELMGSNVLSEIMRRSLRSNIKFLADSEHTKLSATELTYYTEVLVGAYQAIDVLYYNECRDTLPMYEFMRMKQHTRIRLLNMRDEDVIKAIDYSLSLLKEMDFLYVTLL